MKMTINAHIGTLPADRIDDPQLLTDNELDVVVGGAGKTQGMTFLRLDFALVSVATISSGKD
jgi:hypothetical protein